MPKSSVPRALAHTATAVALAGAVMVPNWGLPAFADEGGSAGNVVTRPAASISIALQSWHFGGRYGSYKACVAAGKASRRVYYCYQHRTPKKTYEWDLWLYY